MRNQHLLPAVWFCAVVLAALLALTSCATPTVTGALLVPSGRPQQADPKSPPSERLSRAINDFGLTLLLATATETTGNVVVSPASVHAALSMTANGATDETAQQMRTVLRTDSMSPAETNRLWASLLAGLAARSSDQTLAVANALWATEGIAFRKPFVDADRDYFGAQMSAHDSAKIVPAINDWVSKNTRGMITTIIDAAALPRGPALYLTNAVYFKGDWVTPFRHQATRKSAFTRADGSKVDIDMMNASEQMPYAENAALQATRLPYKGGDSAYYVMLPKQGVSLNTALASLQGAGFEDLRRAMSSNAAGDVILGLPKLDADFSTDLKKALVAIGMPRAFDPELAQFSDMADEPLFIGRVMHTTKVKVDERGTEAAAATVVEMLRGGSSGPSTPVIICDRPYAFAIVDEKSGAVLFLGAVNDPGN